MSDIVRTPKAAPLDLHRAVEEARSYVTASVPESTQRAYRADWLAFTGWAKEHGAASLPAKPETVAAYLAERARDVRPGTLRRCLAAISKAHKLAGHPTPCTVEPVPSVMKGIERSLGTATTPKAAATFDAVERLVGTFPTTTAEGLRNRALLLVGFAGAFRRSELVAVAVSDLAWSDEGVVVTVPKSKTDQRGEGMTKPIPFVSGRLCAATALRAWLTASGIKSGAVFRGLHRNGAPRSGPLTPQSVALVVKAACVRAGLDPEQYSGHSLRAGHVTEARARGVADADTMSVTGHRRVETLNVYDRRNNPFTKTSAGAVQGPKK
jgi:site-specific recombinase XerD